MKVHDLVKLVENFDLVLSHTAIMQQKGAEMRKGWFGDYLGTAEQQ